MRTWEATESPHNEFRVFLCVQRFFCCFRSEIRRQYQKNLVCSKVLSCLHNNHNQNQFYSSIMSLLECGFYLTLKICVLSQVSIDIYKGNSLLKSVCEKKITIRMKWQDVWESLTVAVLIQLIETVLMNVSSSEIIEPIIVQNSTVKVTWFKSIARRSCPLTFF